MSKTLMISMLTILSVAQSATPIQNNTAPAWERYRVTSGHFSVSMPSLPVVIERQQYGQGPYGIPPFGLPQPKAANTYFGYLEGVAYLAIYFANPKHEERLEYFLEHQLKLIELRNAEMSPPAETTQTGRRMLTYEFKKFDYRKVDSYPGTLKLVDDKDRAFALIAIGKDQTDAAVARFLQSLEIADKPSGVDIGKGGSNAGDASEPRDAILAPSNVAHKAMIIIKTEPQYTEEARRKQLRGTVTVKAVLSASGKVSNIEPVSGPREFYAPSIAAVGKTCFIPAVKDGHFVSTSVEMIFNFNLY